jgi:hypothetical protein
MRRLDVQAFEERPDLSIKVTAVLLGGLTVMGLWTRMAGLGERRLALDEYYFVKSVENIVEYVPWRNDALCNCGW